MSDSVVEQIKFVDLPLAVRTLWVKSRNLNGHGLLAHMLDVASEAETTLKLEPPNTRNGAATVFGIDSQQVGRGLAAPIESTWEAGQNKQ